MTCALFRPLIIKMIKKQKQNRKTEFGGFNRPGSDGKRPWLRALNKFLFAAVIAAGLGFVVGVNNLSIKGFVLRELKIRLAEAENDRDSRELRIMELESYENLQARAHDMKMVKVDRIDYVTVVNDEMAKK